MASNSNRGNQALVPQAREALNKFKMESASEVGVPPPWSRSDAMPGGVASPGTEIVP